MAEYQVLARRYRPQQFRDVVGQVAIVTTLKNAIKQNKVAHAYLFCGPRGTGKTTLARLFAKALNCLSPTDTQEPCNQCASCKEIKGGCSLDILEIDGASNRGIEEIRQIRETTGYSSNGKYRIYIIDEVHMLTKEAFNALLKTLEEPPPTVKFFFATTEPHKVLPTILSRCQRFDLKRIPEDKIVEKLRLIANELHIQVSEEALSMIALRAEGGLRDAESLFDQIIAFHGQDITAQVVSSVLGMMPKEIFFIFDKAGKEDNLAQAFEIASQVFSLGMDLGYFLDALIEHFRTLLLFKLASQENSLLPQSQTHLQQYETSAKLYSQEQLLTILDMLIEAQGEIKLMSSPRIALEALLLRIMRTHRRIPVEFLVRRLSELEQAVTETSKGIPAPSAIKPGIPAGPSAVLSITEKSTQANCIKEDPTPTSADLGLKKATLSLEKKMQPQPPTPTNTSNKTDYFKQQSRYDTLLHFAAVELGGSLEKKS